MASKKKRIFLFLNSNFGAPNILHVPVYQQVNAQQQQRNCQQTNKKASK